MSCTLGSSNRAVLVSYDRFQTSPRNQSVLTSHAGFFVAVSCATPGVLHTSFFVILSYRRCGLYSVRFISEKLGSCLGCYINFEHIQLTNLYNCVFNSMYTYQNIVATMIPTPIQSTKTTHRMNFRKPKKLSRKTTANPTDEPTEYATV